MQRIPQSDLTALKQRVVRHSLEFCETLFPGGRLGPSKDYWIVKDRDFRISLKTGYFWNISNYTEKPKGDLLTLWLIAKNFLVKRVQTQTTGSALDNLRARLSSAGRFGGYSFPSSESFSQGVASLFEWVDNFSVRSEIHDLVGYDS